MLLGNPQVDVLTLIPVVMSVTLVGDDLCKFAAGFSEIVLICHWSTKGGYIKLLDTFRLNFKPDHSIVNNTERTK